MEKKETFAETIRVIKHDSYIQYLILFIRLS